MVNRMGDAFWYGVIAGGLGAAWILVILIFLAAVIQHRGKNNGGGK